MRENATIQDSALSEQDIKLALLAHISSAPRLAGSVIINELPVANSTRRADLVLANGNLQAFEIKSDLDSLRRLDGQIEVFAASFDKVVLVTTERFVVAAVARLPAYVEVWQAYRQGVHVHFRVIRRGKIREIRNHSTLAAYLRKRELRAFVRMLGQRPLSTESRQELELSTTAAPTQMLRSYVLSKLKSRYRIGQCDPLRRRTTRIDFASTTKNAIESKEVSFAKMEADDRSLWSRPVDLSSFEEKFGRLPSERPSTVKLRRTIAR